MRILVSSASGSNGNGFGAILTFSMDGKPMESFGPPGLINDPRGMNVHSDGQRIFVNLGDDRVMSFSKDGQPLADSGFIDGLNPGGGQFGVDGSFYVGLRTRRTIVAFEPALDASPRLVLPEGVVPFPRGFAVAPNGRLFLASGVGPDGRGDNTIVEFTSDGSLVDSHFVDDPELSPLDLTLAPNGNIVVSSEHPFGDAKANATLREYDVNSGQLVRVFVPGAADEFSKPRGIRFGPDGRLYGVSQDRIAAFDFQSGLSLGYVVHLDRLNGQAVEFF